MSTKSVRLFPFITILGLAGLLASACQSNTSMGAKAGSGGSGGGGGAAGGSGGGAGGAPEPTGNCGGPGQTCCPGSGCESGGRCGPAPARRGGEGFVGAGQNVLGRRDARA